jgi:hypothetical protein
VQILKRGDPESPPTNPSRPAHSACCAISNPLLALSTRPKATPQSFATWITILSNPLTARVIVNRLWHGTSARASSTRRATSASAAASLRIPNCSTILANEFITHRLELEAHAQAHRDEQTYRQRGALCKVGLKTAVPSDRIKTAVLWRQNPRRSMPNPSRRRPRRLRQAQHRMGGPGYHRLQLHRGLRARSTDYITPDKPELWRRSIYRFIVRTTPHKFMTTLGLPRSRELHTRPRANHHRPAIAHVFNNEFMLQQARHLASASKRNRLPQSRLLAYALCFQRTHH